MSSTSYALRIGVSVIELYGSEFVISHTFLLKFYSTIIAHTEFFLMYVLKSLYTQMIPYSGFLKTTLVCTSNLALDLFYMCYSSYANSMNLFRFRLSNCIKPL